MTRIHNSPASLYGAQFFWTLALVSGAQDFDFEAYLGELAEGICKFCDAKTPDARSRNQEVAHQLPETLSRLEAIAHGHLASRVPRRTMDRGFGALRHMCRVAQACGPGERPPYPASDLAAARAFAAACRAAASEMQEPTAPLCQNAGCGRLPPRECPPPVVMSTTTNVIWFPGCRSPRDERPEAPR
jgi:hypothetical protein